MTMISKVIEGLEILSANLATQIEADGGVIYVKADMNSDEDVDNLLSLGWDYDEDMDMFFIITNIYKDKS